jgi:repressor LexA
MSFGDRLRACREERKISRAELAQMLGVSPSAIGNYETGVSFPKENVMLQLFDCLQVEPNELYQDSYHGQTAVTYQERELLKKYRGLSLIGRETVRSVLEALCSYQEEMAEDRPAPEFREIPLYRTPAAAGYVSPVFGEDYDLIPVSDEVPAGAEFAVRISGDSMEPVVPDGSVAYVNRDPLKAGDVGIFWVDGDMFCKQYYQDPMGMVYLFSVNRERADADVVFGPESGRKLVCFGRVILPKTPPLPGRA